MGNFVAWFARSYRAIIIVLVAIMAVMLVILAMQHVSSTRVSANAVAGPVPTFTSQPAAKRVAIIGDSYTACSAMGGCGTANYTRKIAPALGWSIKTFAVGGTGYTNSSGGKTTFGERVDDVIAAKPDIVVVEGGRNDLNAIDRLPAATTDTLTRLKSSLPDAKLIVIGPIGTASSPETESTARDIIAAAATGVGADLFIDPIADGWFTGADAKYIGVDGLHPTDDGHNYMADKLKDRLAPFSSRS